MTLLRQTYIIGFVRTGLTYLLGNITILSFITEALLLPTFNYDKAGGCL